MFGVRRQMDKQTDGDIEALEENMGLKNLRIYELYHNVQVFNYVFSQITMQCADTFGKEKLAAWIFSGHIVNLFVGKMQLHIFFIYREKLAS